ncbi:MAG: ABC transporter permease [Mariniblastus sp.]
MIWKLVFKYLMFHKYKSLIMIGCIFLTALLPVVTKMLLWQFNDRVVARANSTPAVIGARGSDLDLTLSTLYFKTGSVDTIPFSEVEKAREDDLARAIPVHAMFTAREHSVVGTSLEYFEFRGLKPASGSMFATLGDCVIGSRVAKKHSLSVGGQIISDRENVIDLAGQSPLKLNITGVLAESRTSDDWAVFVDLKTVWVIQGLGHGHQDLAKEESDSGAVLSRTDNAIVASAAVAPFIEITPGNIESFHFHGDTSDFPITSIIAVADNVKNETLLEGHYGSSEIAQFVRPSSVIQELMSMVFQVQKIFDANAILIAISTALLLVLVVLLSIRLRKREMETMFKLGCSRTTISQVLIGELEVIFGIAIVLLVLAVWGIGSVSGDIIESLLVNGRF